VTLITGGITASLHRHRFMTATVTGGAGHRLAILTMTAFTPPLNEGGVARLVTGDTFTLLELPADRLCRHHATTEQQQGE
jgi:hypothetical protein